MTHANGSEEVKRTRFPGIMRIRGNGEGFGSAGAARQKDGRAHFVLLFGRGMVFNEPLNDESDPSVDNDSV